MIWHIFRKDFAGYWRQAALSIALLALLAVLDAGRTGATPGAVEGWLHLLVPLAWSFLIASVVREDSLIGDAAVWKTLPLPWYRLAAAKLLFALVAIHGPLLAAQIAVLSARGLGPLSNPAGLAIAQLGLLAVITLPSLALASLVGSLAQFSACVVPLTALLAAAAQRQWTAPWRGFSLLDALPAASMLFAGSIWVLAWQYRRRPLAAGRLAGAGFALLTVVLYALLPRSATAPLHAAFTPRGDQPVRLMLAAAGRAEAARPRDLLGQGVVAAIPVKIAGWPEGRVRAEPVTTELVTPGGESVKADSFPSSHSYDRVRFESYLFQPGDEAPQWLALRFHPELFRRLRDVVVKVKGTMLLHRSQALPPVPLAREGRTAVRSVGLCGTSMQSGYLGRMMLRVTCESASSIPFGTRARLVASGSDREWTEHLGGAWTHVPGPQVPWLSPVCRRDAFFHVVQSESQWQAPGGRWVVPAAFLAESRVEVQRFADRGAVLFRFGLDGITLAQYTQSLEKASAPGR